jgi:hypothetical protein
LHTFASLIFITTFVLILSILHMQLGNIKAYAAPCVNNISGKWNGNDGGTYWIMQSKTRTSWFGASGLQEGTAFANVFQGWRSGDTITGYWADVPMGKIMQGGGISFTCIHEGGIDKLIRKSQTGGFGATLLSKLSTPPGGPPLQPPPNLR